MGKKVAVVLTDLFEDVEYTDPAKALKEAGHELTVIENKKGNVVKEKNGEIKITVDMKYDEVILAVFYVYMILGVFSPDILSVDERFVEFSKAFMDAKKPVLTIYHGPHLLITAKALNGRKATGYKSI